MRNCWSRLFLRETQDAANNQVGVLTLIFTYSLDSDAGAAEPLSSDDNSYLLIFVDLFERVLCSPGYP